MSLYHYIASSIPLPLGEMGGRKSSLDRSGHVPPKAIRFLSSEATGVPLQWDFSSIKEEGIEVYDTLEDAAGIYISELGQSNEAIRKQFIQPYVYVIAPNWGKFHFNPEMKRLLPKDYKACVKCVTVLFDLMRESGDHQERFELYSCCVGKEIEERDEKQTKTIRISTFLLGDRFELNDRQYVSIVK